MVNGSFAPSFSNQELENLENYSLTKTVKIMTTEELQDILHVLGLDYEADANQIYVFYVLPDGRVDNFSLTVRRGARMNDKEIVALMRREYPATRQGEVMAVERPDWRPAKEEWLDANDVCAMLKISRRTLQRWTKRGVFKAVRIEDHAYYKRTDIDDTMNKKLVQENGRIDSTAL